MSNTYQPTASLNLALGLAGFDRIDDTITHKVSNPSVGLLTATTLANTMVISATTARVTSGAVWPLLSGTDGRVRHIKIGNEIMKVTARTGATLTVARAQRGTSAHSHATASDVLFWTDQSRWIAVFVAAATVFDTQTVMEYGDRPDVSTSFAAGVIVNGPFTQIDLASGTVHAIRG